MQVDSLEISIESSSKKATASLNQLIKKLELLNSKLTSVSKNSQNAFAGIGSTETTKNSINNLHNQVTQVTKATKTGSKAIKNYALSFATLYASIRALQGSFALFKESVTSTADYLEAFNYYTVAFGKVASKWDKSWEEYGDQNAQNYSNAFVSTMNDTFSKLSGISYDPKTGLISETGLKNLGLNLKQVTQYAAQLASMMDAVGQSGETTLATTNAFVKLAGDISSLYNIDYENAASKIRSVLQGQSRAGYGFGWDTTMAALQTTADKLDLSKPVSEMTQMEKQQLRILTILEQSRVAFGDLAVTISSPSNMMRQFTNNIQETGVVLGQLFVPMLQKVLPVVNGVTIAIKRLLTNIAGFLGIEIKADDFGQGFNDMENDTDGFVDSMDDLTEATKKAKGALRGFDELKVINTSDTGAIKGMEDTLDLTDEILAATSEYEKVWNEAFDKMENKAEQFADKFELLFEPFAKLFEDLTSFNSSTWKGFTGFFDNLGDVAWPIVKDGFEAVGNFVKKISPSAAEKIGEGFGALAIALVTIAGLSGISKTIGGIISAVVKHPLISTVGIVAGAFALLATSLEKINDSKEIETYGDTLENINTNAELFAKKISDSIGEIHSTIENAGAADIAYIKDLWEEYQTLATKTDLSADEIQRLKSISEKLENYIPGFNTIIGTETETWEEQVDAVNKLIAEKEKMYKLDAAKGMITSAYENQIAAEKKYQESLSKIEGLESERDAAFQEYYDAQKKLIELEKETGTSFSKTGTFGNLREIPEDLKKAAAEAVSAKEKYQELQNQIDNLTPSYQEYADTLAAAKEHVSWIYDYIAELEGVTSTSAETAKTVTSTTSSEIEGMVSDVTSAISGIQEDAEKSANETQTAFKKTASEIESVVNKLNNLHINIPFTFGVNTIENGLKLNIPKYEVGGFPKEYSLFMAGEHGYAEMLGTVGGKTAVAGGAEITGIKDAVYQVGQSEVELLKEQNSLLRQILQKEMGISRNDLFESVRSSANDFFNRTGNPAFSY